QYATHALAIDELDVAEINGRSQIRALWWVPSVPTRAVRSPAPTPRCRGAAFIGAVYGDRARWLSDPCLRGLVVARNSLEPRLRLHHAHDLLHRAADCFQRGGLPARPGLALYLAGLRRLRRTGFALYAACLRANLANVNLPQVAKA